MKGQSLLNLAILNLELALRDLKCHKDKEITFEHMQSIAYISEGDILTALNMVQKFMELKNGETKET